MESRLLGKKAYELKFSQVEVETIIQVEILGRQENPPRKYKESYWTIDLNVRVNIYKE